VQDRILGEDGSAAQREKRENHRNVDRVVNSWAAVVSEKAGQASTWIELAQARGRKGQGAKAAVGMEIIAKDDADITPRQRENAIKFIQSQYPSTPVYGHSEVSPRDRTNEGVDIARTIRQQRENQSKQSEK
jgi:hypothetical protein